MATYKKSATLAYDDLYRPRAFQSKENFKKTTLCDRLGLILLHETQKLPPVNDLSSEEQRPFPSISLVDSSSESTQTREDKDPQAALKVKRLLGSGSFGKVYMVEKDQLNFLRRRKSPDEENAKEFNPRADFVLKLYNPQLHKPAKKLKFPKYMEDLFSKSELLPTSLSSLMWEGFVRVGPSLENTFARAFFPAGSLDLFEAISTTPELVDPIFTIAELWSAIIFLQGNWIVHRDIKLENVVLVRRSLKDVRSSMALKQKSGTEGQQLLTWDNAQLSWSAFWRPVLIDYDLAALRGSICLACGTPAVSPPKLRHAIKNKQLALVCSSHDFYGLTKIMRSFAYAPSKAPWDSVTRSFLYAQRTKVLKVVLPAKCNQGQLEETAKTELESTLKFHSLMKSGA